MKEVGIGIILLAIGLALLAGALFGASYSWQHYRLWKAEYAGKALTIEQEYQGKAILAKAEHSRMVRIEAAKAEKEAAVLTAEAIKIVGQAAQDYPEYRTQEFVLGFSEALQEGTISQIIYVPTEANIPVLEAGKRN